MKSQDLGKNTIKQNPLNSRYALKLAENLPKDSRDAVAYLCEGFSRWREGQQDLSQQLDNYAEYLSFFALLSMQCEHAQLALSQPDFSGDKLQDIANIIDCFVTVRRELAVMTLDLGLLADLPNLDEVADMASVRSPGLQLSEEEAAQITKIINSLLRLFENEDSFGFERIDLIKQQVNPLLTHVAQKMLDLDNAWRFVSQCGAMLDVLEQDNRTALLCVQDLTSILLRLQSRENRVPKSTLQTVLQKLTNPIKWEEEQSLSRG